MSNQEKFYICESCGELTTKYKILESCSQGGMGLCGCDYMDLVWDSNLKSFKPVYNKYYTEWTEMSKNIYEILSGVLNTVIRLRMFRTIPVEDRVC